MPFTNGRLRKPRSRLPRLPSWATAASPAKVRTWHGCSRLFEEKASGGRWDRPELHRLLDHLRDGDVVVVWKLDRLSRSLKDLLHIMEKIGEAGAGFRSLTEHIDTTTPAGRMMMQMVGAFAEFERAMIRERTSAGLAAARAEGRIIRRRTSGWSGQSEPAAGREPCNSVRDRRSGIAQTPQYASRQTSTGRAFIWAFRTLLVIADAAAKIGRRLGDEAELLNWCLVGARSREHVGTNRGDLTLRL